MVIERALEKLKKTNTEGSDPLAAAMRHTATATRRREAARSDAPRVVKPIFPRLDYDPNTAALNRVLVPHSPVEDDAHADAAYRMLRTRVLHRLRAKQWSTLAITSPGAGEGKSVTSINLAVNLARDNSCDVFLLDLDMRNPSICRYLGVRPPNELISYFAGQCEAQEALFSIGLENLAIAGSVAGTGNASELVANDRLEEMIDYIKSIAPNPVILIDLPPVLVTDEALLVAPRVDATLLVVSEGKTRRDSLQKANQLLADFAIAGVVLNRSGETVGKNTYYYAYGNTPKT